MLERWAQFLLKNKNLAACIAFLCGVLPMFFASISAIIVALITLRKGARDGLFVLVWGILPFLARAYVAKSYLLFAVTIAAFILVWVMAVLLRRYASWNVLLDACVLLSVVIVLGIMLLPVDPVAWWQNHINDYIETLTRQGVVNAADKPSAQIILWMAKCATGAEVFFLFFVASMKIMIARWWEGIAFKTKGLRGELLQARLSRWVIALSALLLLAVGLSNNALFLDTLLPIAGFYVIAGLCLLHYWLQGYKYAAVALFGFYTVVVLFPYVLGVVILLGLVDSGFKLREVNRGSHITGKSS